MCLRQTVKAVVLSNATDAANAELMPRYFDLLGSSKKAETSLGERLEVRELD